MRLLPVWVVTVAGWVVSAAPGPAHTSTHPAHTSTPAHARDEVKGADLGPALRDLARRKRGNNKSNLPYSNYRPVAGIHRYRYPLYKKRSYPPQYDYQDDLLLPEDDFLGYDRDQQEEGGEEGSTGYYPSLFRERNRQENSIFEDDGYFTNDYYPLEDDENDRPLKNKDYMYHLYNLPPSDLERLNHMYEIGKRDGVFSSLDLPAGVRGQLHGVGRKTYAPSASERFYDAIDYFHDDDELRRKRKRADMDPTRGEKLRKLQNYLTSAAGRYWRGREMEDQDEGRITAGDPMIRKKREVNKKSVKTAAKSTTTTTTTTPKTTKNSSSATAVQPSSTPSLRDKRAFSDYFKWEKKRSSSSSYDDYLTREYFKSIARSVGQKKKRMAYAQFEANYPESSKRSGGQEAAKRSQASKVKRAGYNMNELLSSPSMLRYMQDRLKEAEEVVAREAEGKDGAGDTDKLLSNIVIRLDALESMRSALHQLQELQEQEQRRKRNGSVEEEQKKKKRREEEEEEEEERRRRGGKKRSVRRRLRRGDDDISYLFLGNSREDCPVLDRLVVNCEGVSDEVGDDDQVFLPHCLRHEICYMCGAGESVTGHECDAILSSGLEAACSRSMSLANSRSLDCLGAAGTTFSLLSDHSRYDEDGVCTQDPCVRRFLESR